MNDGLLEAFRHNGWATKQLLAFCRGLSSEQLTAPAAGVFGGILATFNHLVLSEAGYQIRMAGSAPAWVMEDDETADFDELEARAEETQQVWERFLSKPFDAEQVILLDQGTYEVRAGVIVTQALHHGTLHREQICSIVTGFGMEPPDLQSWAYGEATGRARKLTSEK